MSAFAETSNEGGELKVVKLKSQKHVGFITFPKLNSQSITECASV